MKIVIATLLATVLSTAAFAQSAVPGLSSAMPGQTAVASNLMHQTLVPHTPVRNHLPQQVVVPQTAFPDDHSNYTPFVHPVPSAHETQYGL